ncbi:MAG: VTT domain-containing protein [Gammaproteobacteria bacterium]|nr:VTT domain-containing protein [Gammaproteobacteria bacterium]
MTDISSPVFQWLNQNPHFAGLFTFIISAAESVAIIGTIIPGSVTMIAIGTLAGAGIIPLYSTIIWAIIGAVVGDGISYWVGRHFNKRLPSIWPFYKYPNLLTNGENFFNKYGGLSVFIGRFVGPVRALVPLVAGMLDMPPLRFTIANIVSAIGWAPAYMLPGILLGAASLELPPDIAVHALIMLLLTGLFIVLCVWIVWGVFGLISRQAEQWLTNLWISMSQSTRLRPITTLLQHHDPQKRHGQLILAFYFLVTLFLLFCLTVVVSLHPGNDLVVNDVIFHTFRSLRSPTWDNIMIAITLLGDSHTLMPLAFTLTVFFLYKKRFHTALHVLFIGLLTSANVYILKHLIKSPRPWGVLQNADGFSFPSGHSTLSVAFYFAITFLLLHIFKPKIRKPFYWIAGMLVLLVSISRLYLGAHWFTDVVGGWLVGAATLMLIILSWNRSNEKPFHASGMIVTILLTLTLSYSINAYQHFTPIKQNAAQIPWPTYEVSIDNWWQQRGDHLPLYRINRFGLARQILNLQWQGSLSTIQKLLLENGWTSPQNTTWIDALHRIANIDSAQHLPLVAPLYLDHQPILVLIKRLPTNHQLIVLRLWQSNIRFTNSALPLWVGTVEIIPSTYGWLFPKRQHTILLTSDILFQKSPQHFSLKIQMRSLNRHYRPRAQPILLLKPAQ